MNVEIGAEAAPFPEKEYISGIFLAVWQLLYILIFRICPFPIQKIFHIYKSCCRLPIHYLQYLLHAGQLKTSFFDVFRWSHIWSTLFYVHFQKTIVQIWKSICHVWYKLPFLPTINACLFHCSYINIFFLLLNGIYI